MIRNLTLIIIALLTCGYLPTKRWQDGKIFENADLVVHSVATSITFKDVETDKEGYKERHFYAHFEIIEIHKGKYENKKISFHIGRQDIFKGKYFQPSKFNSHPMYDIKVGEEYLLELIKIKEEFEPIAYYSSILKISQNEKKEYILESSGKKYTLDEYNKDRQAKIEIKKKL